MPLLALALALGLARPARAALQFDFFPGFDLKVRESSWFPVTCEIFNDGPSFNAVIEISHDDQARHFPIELPTNTRKRVVIPMFAPKGDRQLEWTAKLLDASGKPILDPIKMQTTPVALGSALLGSLAGNFGGSPSFPDVRQNRGYLQPRAARITAEQFPDHPIALEFLSAFYLNSEKALNLNVNQITALLAWVRAGGHLIVAAEQVSDINGTPWLQQFLPMALSDSRPLRLDQEFVQWLSFEGAGEPGEAQPRGFIQPSSTAYAGAPVDAEFKNAEMPVATGQVRDGYVLLTAQKAPLIVEAPRGRGKVTLLTFSPEREPFRGWKARPYFWAKLVGLPGELFTSNDYAGSMGFSADGIFGALIDSRQIKKLPVGWLLALLVVYLLVIGPFDQWWLKKINRQMLTWITFPSYVVLFSLLIWFIGYKLRAGETEWNELSIVDVLPRGSQVDLRGRTYFSIYSSATSRYPIQGQEGFAALRPEAPDYQGAPGLSDKDDVRLVHQGNSYKADVEGKVWTSTLFAGDWFKTNDIPLIASVADVNGEYVLEIENLLPQPLEEVRLVAGHALFECGAIPASSKKTFRFKATEGAALRKFVQENSSFFQQAANLRRSALGDTGGGQLDNRPITGTTASFLSYVGDSSPGVGNFFFSPPGLDLTPQVERGDAVVFAWVPNYSFGGQVNGFKPIRFQQDTLLRLTLPVRQKN